MKWLKQNNFIFLNGFLLLLILIFAYQTLLLNKLATQTHTLQIERIQVENPKDSLGLASLADADEVLVELKGDIKRIEDINDKRFELLGWSLGLILTVVGAFLVVSQVNSKASIRDFVYEELTEKNDAFNKKYEEIMTNINQRNEQMNNEIEVISKGSSK
jgi:cell division protein FtsB